MGNGTKYAAKANKSKGRLLKSSDIKGFKFGAWKIPIKSVNDFILKNAVRYKRII